MGIHKIRKYFMKKKKVLFFLPKGIGGAQKMSIVISQLLPKELYDIKYVIVGKKKEDDMSYLINNQSLIKHVNIINAWDFMTFRLMLILKKEKPDIVFSSIVYLNIRVILAAKFVGNIKIIIRNDNMLTTQCWFYLALLKYTYPKADVIIAQQEEMKTDLLKCIGGDEKKIVVKYNPVDYNLIQKKTAEPSPYNDDETIKYIWTGNFMSSGSKGQDVLVKAFKKVHEKLPNAHLYLLGMCVGNGIYFSSVKDLVESLGLNDYVHFVGFQKNPYTWIKNADCFVLPSRIEGLPNALIDGMILKKPVVATACIPLISRIVKNGYNGYVVSSEDYLAMANAMVKALELKGFEMIYKPSVAEDFIPLFN